MALLSLRAYARHRAEQGLPGTTHRAVQKALERGRITKNQAGLIDSDVADRQWAENSNEDFRRNPGQEPARAAVVVPPAVPQAAPQAEQPTPPMNTLAQAAALERAYKARLAKLDYEERSAKLVLVEHVKTKWQEIISVSRGKVLALPSKIKARVPHLTSEDVVTIDQLVREALEELSQEGQ